MSEFFGHNRTTKNQRGWSVVDPKTAKDPAPRGRVDLDPFAFDDFVKQQGTRVKVFRSMLCPDVKTVDGAEHNIDCAACNGSAWLDVDPTCILAMIQSQTQKTNLQSEGNYSGETIQITFPLGVEVSYFTLIELEDFTNIFYQRVVRKPGTSVDVLKYQACRVNVLIDRAGVRYFQDTDFRLDADGNVLWLGTGAVPADDQIYSVHYEAKIQFRCVSAQHVNRFARHKAQGGNITHIKFPENWLAVKEFLVKRKDRDGTELKQGPYDNHIITP